MNGNYTLKIGSKMWSLRVVPSQQFDAILLSHDQPASDKLGFIDYHLQTMIVRGDCHPDARAEAVIHEILHAALADAGIASIRFDPVVDLSESVVSILGARLLGVLRENTACLRELGVLAHD